MRFGATQNKRESLIFAFFASEMIVCAPQECPTLWRMYQYVSDVERETNLREREEKSTLSIGNGGEAYIATDEWCYNCGDSGHLGDECRYPPPPTDRPNEPSAFGSYNIMSGPFYNATVSSSKDKTRRPRDWESADHLGDGWGFNAPMNVGKQGRRKDRARMEQAAKDQEEGEDTDDWFNNPRNARNRGVPSRRNDRDDRGKMVTFGSMSTRDRKFEFDSALEPSRSWHPDDRNRGRPYDRDRHERAHEPLTIRGAARRDYDYSNGRDRGRSRRYSPEPRQERRGEHRPRYKGGYTY
ncbi:hypothetical protein NEOLEDRAFT_1134919 [Neolentinus lepideus HHB14362 ss-1]|uniref:CCHC-type domain-containing protein n=1 Tax=Neolentinus lepideus HHB14362 ss-1 TaxID=1314782 RepID=A0A165S162_9AGAM|nr:hypothetical protein NEOLEDRAFT_1134919 [Neolentinus lepideus HHB14362 ss-1]